MAEASEANRTLTERPKKKRSDSERTRSRTRVNLGPAFSRWRELRIKQGCKTDAELAVLLLDSFGRIKSESEPDRPSLERSSSSESCHLFLSESEDLSSSLSDEAEQETSGAPSVQSPTNGKELVRKAAADQLPKIEDVWTPISENKDSRVDLHTVKEDKDEKFSTSLSVGDGRYLVDLGSSSEFIVDEECILQLFKSCRQCNKQCTHGKRAEGLKLVVFQECCFCKSSYKWTNLPDDEDNGDFQVNGKDTEHGQNTATSPSRNTSLT